MIYIDDLHFSLKIQTLDRSLFTQKYQVLAKFCIFNP